MDGFTNSEIAEKFAISGNTVKYHLTKVFSKSGISNRLKLVLWAHQHIKHGSAAPSNLK
jgi:two-component system nitrate/nitrite response regulator NarL